MSSMPAGQAARKLGQAQKTDVRVASRRRPGLGGVVAPCGEEQTNLLETRVLLRTLGDALERFQAILHEPDRGWLSAAMPLHELDQVLALVLSRLLALDVGDG